MKVFDHPCAYGKRFIPGTGNSYKSTSDRFGGGKVVTAIADHGNFSWQYIFRCQNVFEMLGFVCWCAADALEESIEAAIRNNRFQVCFRRCRYDEGANIPLPQYPKRRRCTRHFGADRNLFPAQFAVNRSQLQTQLPRRDRRTTWR